ncbi:transposase-like protein [Massilia sp. MP_M2]|uniref:IS1595 family transposase n=1 Tax=Massilia sp. MP_M2 TaxID=3071713 RepID=UPI00319E005E
MKVPRFKTWLARLPSLNEPQRRQVLDALHPAAGLDQVVARIAQARAPGRCCPRCGNERCHRHGFANDLQRFRCCACGRTFNDLSGTPLARLRHKAKWLAYSQVLLDSLSVRKAAERVGVHRNTAFRWRHRFLHWVKLDRPAALNGIVEADEMFLLESQKGSCTLDRPARRRGRSAPMRNISRHLDCILVARDRTGRTIDAVTGRGALTPAQLERDLLPRLDPQALLVSDSRAAYRAFARKHRIAHEAIHLRVGVRGRHLGSRAIHVQNVNAYHQRFKAWLLGFRGVASRYLPNYLGWRWAIDGGRVSSVEHLLCIAIGVINRKR